MPGGFDVMMLDVMVDKNLIASSYHEQAREIVRRLCSIIMFAANGDEESQVLLSAIEKIVQPRIYGIPQNKITELTRYETSPPLARAWELRRIMSHLAGVVEPRNSGRSFRESHPVRMREGPVRGFTQEFWDLAHKYWHPNSTLQSLAISIYLEHLEKQEVISERAAITVRTLKRDLELAREWEANASEDDKTRRSCWHGGIIGDLTITWYEFSEGWKVRAKERALKRTGSKDRRQLT